MKESKTIETKVDNVLEEVCTSLHEVISLWNMSLNNKSLLNTNRKKKYNDMNLKPLHYIVRFI